MVDTPPFNLIIFGITSNLAQIKLIPALYDMAEKGILPENFTVVGVSRSHTDLQKHFRIVLAEHNRHHEHDINSSVVDNLTSKVVHIAGQLDDPLLYEKLKTYAKGNTIFYLATYPELYKDIFVNLNKAGLNSQENGFVRLMIEKPFGADLASAKELDMLLLEFFSEKQLYRLDHYLGKETIQNILTFRFGNGLFEPLLNKTFIDHIQVTSLENFGIGKRGGYYDTVGALKDVGQNHLLQMLAFATMDVPSEFSNEAVTLERLKIVKKLLPMPDKIVLGQYKGYKTEENVSKKSITDTFFAFKTQIQNERYEGVPIYIRGGKQLSKTLTEIAIVFKNPDNRLFNNIQSGQIPNVLIYRIQPNEGIVLKILTKKPGHDFELESTAMNFDYPKPDASHYLPDPYERLLVDCLRGDQTFFNDASEIEAQWAFVDPLLSGHGQPIIYDSGTDGPKEADNLIKSDGRSWIS